MNDDLWKRLDKHADEARAFGFPDVGEDFASAATEIRRLRDELEAVKRRRDAAMDDRDADEARADRLAEELEGARTKAYRAMYAPLRGAQHALDIIARGGPSSAGARELAADESRRIDTAIAALGRISSGEES